MAFSAISRGPVAHHVLVWIEARNRDTGATEASGLWTGPEARQFTVGGVARTYHGAGQMLSVPTLTARAGVGVQMHRLGLSALSDEVEQIMRGYDPRLAPVEIHVARLDPQSDALLGIDRVYRGSIDQAPIVTPAKGGSDGGVSVSLASAARSLTRPLTLKKTDESQRARSDDRFFRFAEVAGKVERFWGTKRVGGGGSGGSDAPGEDTA